MPNQACTSTVRRFTSIQAHTAHFVQHTEITLQHVPNREYTLRLFVENVKKELQRKDNQTWTPAHRPYVPYLLNTYTQQWVTCVEVFPQHPRCALKSE
jgi:glycerol-3-phosphate O-acyltransferase